MPFIIVSIVITVIIGVIHCAYGVSIVALLIGLFAALLMLSVIVNAIVYLANGSISILVILSIFSLGLMATSILLNIITAIIQFVCKSYAPLIESSSRMPVFFVQTIALIVTFKFFSLFCLNPRISEKTRFNCRKIWI